MKVQSALSALCLSLILFSVLALIFGQTGLLALKTVIERQTALQDNINNLESRQRVLQSRLSSLRTDPDSVMVEARNLGLYREGDYVMILDESNLEIDRPDAGGVLVLPPLEPQNEDILRILAIAAGLLSVLVFLVMDGSSKHSVKKS